VVWRPSPEYVERANVTRFMRANGIGSHDELVARSTADVEWFWDAVVRDLGIDFSTPYERVLDTSRGVEWATWFVGGELNLAHNCLDRWADRTPHALALVWEGEDGEVRRVSYEQLRLETDRLAHALRAIGVGPGDAVGIFLPMAPETVAATLACAKVGAVYVPIFSGFGAEAVATRLADARARVLLTADGFLHRGSVVQMKESADRAADLAGCVEHLLVWLRLDRPKLEWNLGRDLRWDDFVGEQPGHFETESFPAEHPLFIGYTSGTSGRPKGAVHVHGGFLVKISEEVAYQADLHQGEVLHWVTDLGWIMGPWELVGAGALGATVLLTEGSPTHPGADRLWATIERHGVTTLGVSPTLIRSLIPHGEDPVRSHDLSSLRVLASTGEPWNPEPYMWLFREVGEERLPIINLSGGTEVGACFLSPLPISELKPCTLRGAALGMDVAVLRSDGTPADPGEVGELVCRKPWPAMTRGIWGDPERYVETYWRRFPGVWTHGDWASVDEDGFWFLHGRSDDTVNIAGRRLGPAEVESVLAEHPAVLESAAVGVPDEVRGETIWCFVVAKHDVTDTLASELAELVADRLGKPFKPGRVLFIPALPKTRSAKIVRRAIRATVLEEDPGDVSTLEDPAALDAIRAALRRGSTRPPRRGRTA